VRERIRRGVTRWHERRQAALKVVPSDLARLGRGDVPASLAPFVADAGIEAAALHAALGADAMSPQRSLLIADTVRVGVVLRAELARYLRTQDPDAGGRVGTLAGVRRAGLLALGLDEVRVERDLATYLATAKASDTAKDRVSATIATPADSDADPGERGLA
jgi:hypothetical protein